MQLKINDNRATKEEEITVLVDACFWKKNESHNKIGMLNAVLPIDDLVRHICS